MRDTTAANREMDMPLSIQVEHVAKRYGATTVLDDVSLTVAPGQMIGLVGANGTGKTTLLRLVAGLARPTRGSISLGGKNLADDWAVLPVSVGVLFEPPGLLPNLTGLDNLLMLAAVRGQLKAAAVRGWMEKVGLDPLSRRRVGHYSQGMKKRLGLAQALMESPDVLLLDEPTNGLDPDGVAQLATWLAEAQRGGAAIILAGHDLAQMSRICGEVWRMTDGRLVPADISLVVPGQAEEGGGSSVDRGTKGHEGCVT